ncbi:MAG: hypothetical protein AAF871_02520 [Pseudomonadota bacterium]
MTLEKILILGFALALIGALTAVSTGMIGPRDTAEGQWRTKVQDLADKAK